MLSNDYSILAISLFAQPVTLIINFIRTCNCGLLGLYAQTCVWQDTSFPLKLEGTLTAAFFGHLRSYNNKGKIRIIAS